jgi:hypothetical protein
MKKLGRYMAALSERGATLDRLVNVCGGSLQALEPADGISRLQSINELLLKSHHRMKNSNGRPGSIVNIPDHPMSVIVGDLHAKVNNLLTILCTADLLRKLEDGTAALIFLGDAIHDEEPHALAAMDSSLMMMDLIFTLMLRYPHQITYLTGNHDGFSEEIVKDGVPQGVLWAKHLSSARGEVYRDQMQQFYHLSPLLAQSSNFLACHAGPPLEPVSPLVMNNIEEYPQIANDLAWNRARSPACPSGYTRGDVRRFRKSMGVDPNFPFIVGHSPLSDGATIWQNISHTPNHHLVYSAQQHQVGVFTHDGDFIRSHTYATEPLLDQVNQLAQIA